MILNFFWCHVQNLLNKNLIIDICYNCHCFSPISYDSTSHVLTHITHFQQVLILPFKYSIYFGMYGFVICFTILLQGLLPFNNIEILEFIFSTITFDYLDFLVKFSTTL